MPTVFLVIALLTSGSLSPRQAGSVAGTVVRAGAGTPLADVRVTLVESGRQVRTDANGRFELTGVSAGPATLTFSTIGFSFVRRQVEVTAGARVDLVIPLAEGTGTYEETVTVTTDAAADEPGRATRVLGPGALQDLRGVAADDPVRAVQALPGVATGDDFQAEFSVRGSAFRHVGMVVDGVSTPFLFHAVRGTEDTGSIAMINTDVLGRAGLSIGPHAQRHGAWLGPTLEFELREGSRTRTAARVSVSGTSAALVGEGPLGPRQRGSWIVSARKSYVDWLVRKIEPEIETTIGFSDAQGKAAYDVAAGHQVQLSVVGGRMIYQDWEASSANEIRRARSTSVLAAVTLRSTTRYAVFHNRVALVRNVFRNTGVALQEQARGDNRSWLWRSDATLPLRGWTVEAGAQRDWQRGEQTLKDWVAQSSGLRLRSQQTFAGTRAVSGLYVQSTGRLRGVELLLGIRGSFDSRLRAHAATPWLLAERQVGGWTFAASAARAVQFPTIEKFGQAATALRPETAVLGDASVERPVFSSIVARGSVFARRESNLLRPVSEERILNGTRIPASRFPSVRSSIDATTRGVDVILERRAERGPTGWIGYTWAHTRHEDTVSRERFDGDYDQRHTLNVFVQQRLSYRLKVHAKLRYGSNFPIVGYFAGEPPDALVLASTRNGLRLPAYARVDINASRTFTFTRSRLTLFVEVMNATGRRNYGLADGFIRNNTIAEGYVERLLPLVPSAGVLVEF